MRPLAMHRITSKFSLWRNTAFVCCSVFTLALLLPGSKTYAKTHPWKLRAQRDGVAVWSRPVEGSSFWMMRGHWEGDIPAEKIWRTLIEQQAYPAFMPYVHKVQALDFKAPWLKPKASPLTTWRAHHIIDLPGIKSRDVVLTIKPLAQGENQLFELASYAEQTQNPPPSKNYVRIDKMHTHWWIRTLPSGKTAIVYKGFSDPEGNLPAFIVNPMQTSSIRNMVLAVLAQARTYVSSEVPPSPSSQAFSTDASASEP